jgi:hypothetical protein
MTLAFKGGSPAQQQDALAYTETCQAMMSRFVAIIIIFAISIAVQNHAIIHGFQLGPTCEGLTRTSAVYSVLPQQPLPDGAQSESTRDETEPPKTEYFVSEALFVRKWVK